MTDQQGPRPTVGVPQEVADYRAGIAARKGGGLPKMTESVAAPAPRIPPLGAPHHPGMTMSEQAAAFGPTPAQRALAASTMPGSIVETGPAPTRPLGGPAPAQSRLQLLPTDTLPPEAIQDPLFRAGTGAQYASAQDPALVRRYGVVRNGALIPPQQLEAPTSGGGAGGRPWSETLQDLQAVAGMPALHPPETAASAAEDSPMVEVQEEKPRALAQLSDLELAELRRILNKDDINNPEQRELIESRLKPLEIDELILHNRVKQEVPIIPDKLWVTFESLTGEEDLALKQLLMEDSKSAAVTEQYMSDRLAYMSLAAGCFAIRGNPLPTHRDADGKFNRAAFQKKLDWVMQKPLHLLATLGVNHTWFELRVRKLFVAEKVKNG